MVRLMMLASVKWLTICIVNSNHQTNHRDTLGKRTQFTLLGQPTGWAAMAHAVRNFDEEKVKDCKEDIDTLLVFVRRSSHLESSILLIAFQ